MSYTAPRAARTTKASAGGSDGEPRLMRPITNPTAIELARQLVRAGTPGIELHPDGTFWACGVDRRQRPAGAS